MASADLEKGPNEGSTTNNVHNFNLSSEMSYGDLQRNKGELEVFQTLVGIHFLAPGGGPNPDTSRQIKPAHPLADIFMPSKTAANRFRNRGLYDRVLSQDLKNRSMYTIARYIVIFLYLVQITIAATFTALSAYQRSSVVAVTTLGAINTVIAGVLAWLSGQGMPVRFRRARNQYREVVKAIEATERMFAEIDDISWPRDGRPHPIKERDRLERMYDEARLDQEANYPETQHEPAAKENAKKKGELEGKIAKKKAQKEELEAMRKELETLRRNSSTVG